jgi:hypothetical protein
VQARHRRFPLDLPWRGFVGVAVGMVEDRDAVETALTEVWFNGLADSAFTAPFPYRVGAGHPD